MRSPDQPKSARGRGYATVALFSFLLLAAACSDSTGPQDPRPPKARYTLEIIGGDTVSGTVGTILPVEVLVRDSTGAPVAGLPVGWRTAPGSGVIHPASATTGLDGQLHAAWTLGTTSGEQQLFIELLEDDEVSVIARALPDSPVSLTMPVDTVAFHAIREEVLIRPRVRDRYGNATAKLDLAWTSTDPAIAVVDASGRVIAKAEGAATISAGLGELEAALQVVVAPRGAISITFDDGFLTTYTNAFPVLREFDLPANVGVYTAASAGGWPSYLTESHLRELHDAGWSMASHSVSHPYLPTLSDDELRHELEDSRAWLVQRGFRGSNIFLVPFHDWGARERAAIAEHYDAARGTSYKAAWPDSIVEWLPADPYALTAIEMFSSADTSSAESARFTSAEGRETLRLYLDRVVARNEYVDVFFHRVPDQDVEDFRKLVEILAEYRAYIRPFHELFGPPRILE